MTTTIVSGDDISLPVTLYQNDVTFTIDPGATVEARVISVDRTTVYAATVAVTSGTAGSDWPNSLIVVEFPSSATIDLEYSGTALLEIQIDDSGKTTYFDSLAILIGTIP